MAEIVRTPFSRLFLIEDGAAPNNTPEYQGLGRAGAISFGQGTITPVRKPSASSYGQFETIDTIRGAPDLPQLTIEQRFTPLLSNMLRIVNKGCPVDLHIHFGECEDPEDFDAGWQKELILESAVPSDYSTDDLGALDADQDAVINESVPFSGQRLYDVKKLRPSEVGSAEVTDIINRVIVCDSKTCGECGIASDGCQVLFAISGPNAGSPGLPSEVLYSQDGGSTWAATNITTLSLTEDATDAACVGPNLVVVSSDSNSLHYAPLRDILNGVETWTEVTTGFVASKLPNRIISLGRGLTWIAADGGYVYFSDDVTSGVTVQTDGSQTAQNLVGLHAFDKDNIVAVGGSNAIVQSANGGTSWGLIVGPTPGIGLNTVFMQSAGRWLVGTADGRLFYTLNEGTTWAAKGFPGSGAGQVRDIQFASRNIGYMVHDTATPRGRALRTTNGGNSWVVMPEETGLPVPSVGSLRTVAACEEDVNVVFVGGTQVSGTDGYLAKYA